jgi:hypothetical protein
VIRLLIALVALPISFLLIGSTGAQAVQTERPKVSVDDQIARATNRIAKQQLYTLEYKLKKGDELRWDFEQVVETKFQMAGFTEESSSRSENRRLWKVANVDQLGNMTFVCSVESIKMWQKTGEADPVSYDSKIDKEVPDEYAVSAESVGKPQAIFFITPSGRIKDRRSMQKEYDFGAGQVTVPLPEKPVAIGYQWSIPTVLSATDDNDRPVKLKARILYTLAKVVDRNAFISFRTEVLTPVTSEKIKSVIMQKMNKGTIVFDIVRGYPVLKRVLWDEKAQGFEGPDSYLKYVGSMSEKFVIQTKAEKANGLSALSPVASEVARKQVEVKTSESKPVLRK